MYDYPENRFPKFHQFTSQYEGHNVNTVPRKNAKPEIFSKIQLSNFLISNTIDMYTYIYIYTYIFYSIVVLATTRYICLNVLLLP